MVGDCFPPVGEKRTVFFLFLLCGGCVEELFSRRNVRSYDTVVAGFPRSPRQLETFEILVHMSQRLAAFLPRRCR